MIHEDLQVTGSYQVSGSLRIPFGPSASRTTATGSIFFDTDNSSLEIYRGTGWHSGSGAGSGGGGGAAETSVEYLVIAGGGGGGSYGGGGAGGHLSSSFTLSSGSSYTITVGSGGAGSGNGYNDPGNDGGDSSVSGTDITTVTSTGGGHGGDNIGGSAAERGGDGGSGGGGSDGTSTPGSNAGGSGTSGQGNDGGDGTFSDPTYMGGGGGGAGTAGANATLSAAGNGGNGLASSITGTSTTRAGGGGGVRYNTTGTQASGGTGGGGEGGTWSGNTVSLTSATAGTVNTGGGGGSGQAGGSGVVILAYDSGSVHGAGGIKGDAGNGRRYHQFNSSDSFVMGSTNDFNIVTGNLIHHYDAGDFASRGTSTFTDLEGSTNGTVSGASLGSNYYYDLDGSNDNITFGDVTYFDSGDFTFEIWVRINTSEDGSLGMIALKRAGSDFTNPFGLSFDDRTANGRNNTIGFLVGGGGSSFALARSDAGEYTLGDWAHVVCTLSGNSLVLYLDGSSYATATFSGTRQSNNETFRLGGPYTGGGSNFHLDCDIAQVRVYDDALTAAEVLQNYNATKTNFV